MGESLSAPWSRPGTNECHGVELIRPRRGSRPRTQQDMRTQTVGRHHEKQAWDHVRRRSRRSGTPGTLGVKSIRPAAGSLARPTPPIWTPPCHILLLPAHPARRPHPATMHTHASRCAPHARDPREARGDHASMRTQCTLCPAPVPRPSPLRRPSAVGFRLWRCDGCGDIVVHLSNSCVCGSTSWQMSPSPGFGTIISTRVLEHGPDDIQAPRLGRSSPSSRSTRARGRAAGSTKWPTAARLSDSADPGPQGTTRSLRAPHTQMHRRRYDCADTQSVRAAIPVAGWSPAPVRSRRRVSVVCGHEPRESRRRMGRSCTRRCDFLEAQRAISHHDRRSLEPHALDPLYIRLLESRLCDALMFPGPRKTARSMPKSIHLRARPGPRRAVDLTVCGCVPVRQPTPRSEPGR